MSDLISRQAAIDAIDKYSVWVTYTQGDSQKDEAEFVENIIKQTKKAIQSMLIEDLPSAQPIQTASNYLQSLPTSPLLVGKMPSAQPDVPDICVGDVVSRQWLMECVNEGWIKFDTEKDENRFIHLVRDIAPSAQPDRSLWFRIGEICVDESKGFISSGRAVEKIRELLREAERSEE